MYLNIYDADYSPKSAFREKRKIINSLDFQTKDLVAVFEPGDKPGDKSDEETEHKKLRIETHTPD